MLGVCIRSVLERMVDFYVKNLHSRLERKRSSQKCEKEATVQVCSPEQNIVEWRPPTGSLAEDFRHSNSTQPCLRDSSLCVATFRVKGSERDVVLSLLNPILTVKTARSW